MSFSYFTSFPFPLQNAHGEKDAHESALSKFKHQLQTEQKKVKEYEQSVPDLEDQLSATKEQLESTRHSLEEKTTALVQTRKHLKNARERGMVCNKFVAETLRTYLGPSPIHLLCFISSFLSARSWTFNDTEPSLVWTIKCAIPIRMELPPF